MNYALHRTKADTSKGKPPSNRVGRSAARLTTLLLLLGAVGAVALLLATILPVLVVEADATVPESFSQNGWQLHGPLLLIFALAATAALLRARQGRQLAMLAVAICGALVLLLALLTDVGQIGDSGLLPGSLAEGFVTAGPGAYLELLGAILLLLSGGLLSMLSLDS